jgi:putative ABC transport system permease protein
MNGAQDISFIGLALSLVFVGGAGLASLMLQLKLGKDLFWGTVRTVAQLFLMGFVLRYVFAFDRWYLVVAVFAVMIFFAARIAKGRVKSAPVAVFVPVFASMLLSYMLVTFFVVAVIVQARPWYHPMYFIPIGGMIIGNSITAVAVSLDRFFGALKKQREEIELFFCLGATYRQASAPVFREAIRAGMIPSITAMMGVGIVWLPGMMTGQILAGADPLAAVKYQIMVMLMLVGSTAIASILVVWLVRRECFTTDDRLKIR